MKEYKNVSTSELLAAWIENSPGAVIKIGLQQSGETPEAEMKLSGKSVLWVILKNFGGIICCDGCVRHFGGGNRFCASLYEINGVQNGLPTLLPGMLVVAEDSGGGIFGINCGFAKEFPAGSMFYLPFDSYDWEALEIGHADFVRWTLEMDKREWLKCGWGGARGTFTALRTADVLLKGRLGTYTALRKLKGDDFYGG